jgi:glycosyltransferase involved in cell wall biosynthesis
MPPDGPILWFVPSLGTGGAERICIDLANTMVQRGRDVVVVTATHAGARRAELDPRVELKELGTAGVAAAVPGLARVIRELRPRMIVAVMDHANIAAWFAARVARSAALIAFTTHVDFSHAFEELPYGVRRCVVSLYRWLYPRVALRIAVSQGVADSLAAGLDIDRGTIAVLHNPVPVERIRARAGCGEPIAAIARGDSALIVGLGRLTVQKDFETLLCAAARVALTRPVRVLILGEGPERERLTALAARLGVHLRLPGFVANPYPFLSQASVFVSSSRWEGFGVAIVEAMALRVPVVATDCPSGPAEILDGGRCGRLVPMGDVEAMAVAIAEALEDAGPLDAAAARALEFDVGRVADRYLHLFGDATQGSR